MVNTTSETVGEFITSRSPLVSSASTLTTTAATTTASSTTTTIMTLSSHHTHAAVVIADPVDDVERTAIGIPVRMLWVPYIIFTTVILVLIMVSFCKFHKKHGHKYRRRRMELFQQGAANANSLMNQLQGGTTTATTTTGSTHLPPNGGAPSATCNTQMPSTSVMTARETNPNSSTVKKKPKTRRKQRPLTFMRNANGSMVDLRCGERNSMNIFKTPFSTHAESSIWTLPSRSGAYRTLNSPTGNNYFSDEDDDDVLLIHSTKL